MELGFKALEAANAEAIVKIIHGHENMVTHSKPMRLCVEKKNIQIPWTCMWKKIQSQ